MGEAANLVRSLHPESVEGNVGGRLAMIPTQETYLKRGPGAHHVPLVDTVDIHLEARGKYQQSISDVNSRLFVSPFTPRLPVSGLELCF